MAVITKQDIIGCSALAAATGIFVGMVIMCIVFDQWKASLFGVVLASISGLGLYASLKVVLS